MYVCVRRHRFCGNVFKSKTKTLLGVNASGQIVGGNESVGLIYMMCGAYVLHMLCI